MIEIVRNRGIGYIEGGVCDKIHHRRAARERGMWAYFEAALEKDAIVSCHGWHRLVRPLKVGWRKLAKSGLSGDEQIGWLRFQQILIPAIGRRGKAFRRHVMKRWIDGVAALEFGVEMDNPLSILGLGKCEFGYAPPHQDVLYKARKADGEL